MHELFFGPAARVPDRDLLLGGSGWDGPNVPDLPNVRRLGHVPSEDHNAFNCTPELVLNVNREGMARFGFSPATRVFEAAGAGACLVSDAWEGLDRFLEPGREVLVAESGEDVALHLARTTRGEARAIGDAARRRALAEHTYAHRAHEVDLVLNGEEVPAWSLASAS